MSQDGWMWQGRQEHDDARFAAHFFDRHPSSPVVRHLRRAAELVRTAATSADIREATDELAAGMLDVGLDGRPRFLMDAHARATAPWGVSERTKPSGGLVVKVADRGEDERKRQEQKRKEQQQQGGPQFSRQSGGMQVPSIPLLGGAAPALRGAAPSGPSAASISGGRGGTANSGGSSPGTKAGVAVQPATPRPTSNPAQSGLPVNATGRLHPADPVPHAESPAPRHYASRVGTNTLRKAQNTVIMPGVDIQPDLEAIRQGRAMRDGPYYVVGGRYYDIHPSRTVYPVSGPGLVSLDRGAFRALCVYNDLGMTPEAEAMLDREKITPDQRQAARELGVNK